MAKSAWSKNCTKMTGNCLRTKSTFGVGNNDGGWRHRHGELR